MRLGPPFLGNVNRIYEVPILQAVLDDPAIEGVVELAIHRLEVSVAMIVCLLVGS